MNESLFIEWVNKYFAPVVGKISELFNGKKEEPGLLHKTMLTEEYSADLTYASTSINHSVVAADVVSLDSPLPLKKRGAISRATGTIPKIGVKYRKGEKDITDLNILVARGVDEATVANRLLKDAALAVKDVESRLEIMFLEALSTGYVLVDDGTDNDALNEGTGVRANFGYKAENQFNAAVAWADAQGKIVATATPVDDLRKLFTKADADGNAINHIWLSEKYFNLMRSSEQGKELAAAFTGQVITKSTVLPVPNRRTFLEALADEFNAEFHIVKSTFKVEKKDGTGASVSPWAEANLVGTPDTNVGRLVYGTLAEESNPVAGVSYQKSGSYTLVAKYSKTDPLEEFTTAQALAIPVIDNGESIYVLHADEVDNG